MTPKLNLAEARLAMRCGAILIKQVGQRRVKYFIEPGGRIARETFGALRLIPNVVPEHDGVVGSQSWRWTT